MPVANRLGGTDRSTSLRSDERSTSPECVFHIPECVFHFLRNTQQTIHRYQNRAVEAAQVIEELIALARDLREANARGEALGLSDDEMAFYDALGVNDSAVQVLGDETLRGIARELVETVRNNVAIDWTRRENVRARLRVLVKRVLRKHDYPPDRQDSATRTVLE